MPLRAIVCALPAIAGVLLSAARFRAHDPIGGLASALAGLALTVVVVFRMGERPASR